MVKSRSTSRTSTRKKATATASYRKSIPISCSVNTVRNHSRPSAYLSPCWNSVAWNTLSAIVRKPRNQCHHWWKMMTGTLRNLTMIHELKIWNFHKKLEWITRIAPFACPVFYLYPYAQMSWAHLIYNRVKYGTPLGRNF